jgi:hypothetical protein
MSRCGVETELLIFTWIIFCHFSESLAPFRVSDAKRDTYNGQDFVQGTQPKVKVVPFYFTVKLPQISQIVFHCYTDDKLPMEGQTVWLRNGNIVACIPTDRVYACGNSLVLKRVSFQDKGEYKCAISDQQWISYTAQIIVPLSLCNPGFTWLTLSRGGSGQLDCCVSTESYPQPQDILWRHNDQYIAITTSQTFELENFQQNQTGVYECIVFDGFGNFVSKKFFVTCTLSDVPEGNSSLDFSQTVGPVEQATDSGTQCFCPDWFYFILCLYYVLVSLFH